MSDPQAFLTHAEAQVKAEQVAKQLTGDGVQVFLLWKAYLKRIKTPPIPIIESVNEYLILAAGVTSTVFDSMVEASLVADLAGDILWNALDEKAQREWLLKAI